MSLGILPTDIDSYKQNSRIQKNLVVGDKVTVPNASVAGLTALQVTADLATITDLLVDNIDVNGALVVTGFQLITDAGTGLVLVSDDDGVGSWTTADNLVYGCTESKLLKCDGDGNLVDSNITDDGTDVTVANGVAGTTTINTGTGGLYVNAPGTVAVDSTGGVSIDAAGPTNLTTSVSTLTLESTASAVNVVSGSDIFLDAASNVAIYGGSVQGVLINGPASGNASHLTSSQNTAPSVAADNAAAAGVLTLIGTDMAGTVSSAGGTGGAVVVTVTFNQSYGAAPVVVFSANSANIPADAHISLTTTGTFVIDYTAPVAAHDFSYIVIGQ